MLKKKNSLAVLAITLLSSYGSAAFATENTTNKDMACFDLSGERKMAQHFITNAVQQEMLDEPMLVDVGSSLALVSPLESIKLYDSRIKHIDKTYKLLGCEPVVSKLNSENIKG